MFSAVSGAALAVAPYILYELLPSKYKLLVSIPAAVISSSTMGGVVLYNYAKESEGFSPLVLARSIAGATILCGLLFKIEMENAEHEGLDTYEELFESRFGAWLMATSGLYFLTKSILAYDHHSHGHGHNNGNTSCVAQTGIYSSDLITFVAREIALYAVISHLLEEAGIIDKDISLGLSLSLALGFNVLMSVDDHKELVNLLHKTPTSVSDLHEIYANCSIKNCLKVLFSIGHGALESVPLVGVLLGVMIEWKTGEGEAFDAVLRAILALDLAFVRTNSEAQEISELLFSFDLNEHQIDTEPSINGVSDGLMQDDYI